MKTILFILVPFCIFAQNDSLILKNGTTYSGKIIEINEKYAQIEYSSDNIRQVSVPNVERIVLGKMGTIYFSDFLVDFNTIENYITRREENIAAAKKIDIEQQKAKAELYKDSLEKIIKIEEEVSVKKVKNKWSFGILYIPYFSGMTYNIIEYTEPYPAYPIEYEIVGNAVTETNMEAQITLAVNNRLRFTFEAIYTSTFYERRSEYHLRNSGGYIYDSGNLIKEDLTLLDFNFGIKYYLQNIITENVSVFLLFSIGKQFAFAEQKNESLFQTQPPQIVSSKNNQDEFVEESNSPFHFNLGFGAEYFFNESLSLVSNIRFIYSKISAKYDSRIVTDYETNTNTIDFNKSEFKTWVGIGVNFYF